MNLSKGLQAIKSSNTLACLLGVFFLMIPFWRVWSTVCMVLLFLYGLLHISTVVTKHHKHVYYFSILSGLMALLYFISFIIYPDEEHFFEFQKRLAFIFIPFSIWLLPHIPKKVYVYACIGFFIQIFLLDMYTLIKTILFYAEFNYLPFYNGDNGLEKVLLIHRPYLGFLNGIVLLIALYLFIHKKLPYCMLFFIILTLSVIYMISARASFGFVCIAGVLLLLSHYTLNLKVVLGLISIMVVLGGLIFLNPNLKKRFSESLSNEPRTAIWPCAMQAILKNHHTFLWGYGSEIHAQNELNQCYMHVAKEQKKWFWFYDTKLNVTYNTHNVYLEIWLAYGLFALLLLLLLFAIPFIYAIHHHHSLLLAVVVFILLNICFENYFSRQIGIYTCLMTMVLLLRKESLEYLKFVE
jgi:O-antigen ligase